MKQQTYILFIISLWRPKVNNSIEIFTGLFYICNNKLEIFPLNINKKIFWVNQICRQDKRNVVFKKTSYFTFNGEITSLFYIYKKKCPVNISIALFTLTLE